MKIYDFDGMFDEKLSEYISRNPHKYSESEWEDVIPALYKKFGETPINSIGKTPKGFFADMTDADLIKCLKQYLGKNLSVSGFLRSEIEARNLTGELLKMLDGSEGERDFAISVLGADDAAVKKYMDILVSCCDEEVKARCAELISEKADLVVERALENYAKGVEKEYMCEILSHTVIKDDRIFDILIKEFRSSAENIGVIAGFLASYGDERALGYLLDRIDDEGISYLEFRELKFAIESLGGEYKKERDFSNDPAYRLVSGQTETTADIFQTFFGGETPDNRKF